MLARRSREEVQEWCVGVRGGTEGGDRVAVDLCRAGSGVIAGVRRADECDKGRKGQEREGAGRRRGRAFVEEEERGGRDERREEARMGVFSETMSKLYVTMNLTIFHKVKNHTHI